MKHTVMNTIWSKNNLVFLQILDSKDALILPELISNKYYFPKCEMDETRCNIRPICLGISSNYIRLEVCSCLSLCCTYSTKWWGNIFWSKTRILMVIILVR